MEELGRVIETREMIAKVSITPKGLCGKCGIATDPVCGMEIEKERVVARYRHRGEEFYFCNEVCFEKFKKDSERYLKTEVVEEREPKIEGPTEKIKLPLEGMSCASCAQAIEKSLKNLKGVQKAEVNFAQEMATVSFDPTKVELSHLKKAVEE